MGVRIRKTGIIPPFALMAAVQIFAVVLAGCGGIVPGPPPKVSSTSPSDGATDVALNRKITVTFSEEMSPATVTNATFTLNNGVTGTVSYTGVTATFTPTPGLSPTTAYTATITADATDLAGTPLGTDFIWTFITGGFSDTTPPRVTSTSPADDAKNVALDSIITATFSEPMDPATITTAAFILDPGVTGTVVLTETTATFTPSFDLAPDTTYTATITTDVRDLAGNQLGVNHTWTFATEEFKFDDDD